jgi:acetolactate synthase-1/2/3 large subunit
VDDYILLPTEYARRPAPDEAALVQAAEAISTATRPILMIGAAANRQRTAVALRAFIDKLGIPFFTTQMGKGVVDEDHPLWLGNAALSDGDFVHRAIDAADVIINVGHDVVEKPPFFMQRGRRTVIHINFSSAEVDTVYFPQIEVVGDIAHTVERLTDALTPQAQWDFRYFNQVRKAFRAQLSQYADEQRFPMHPVRVVADTRRYMPDDGILCLDNGMYKLWYARYYQARQPNTVLLDNALATMGAGLPSAMAAKLVHPERKVLAICGDGGFMMNAQELETAVRLKLDLVILLLRDDAYGMIRWKQAEMGYADYGMQFGNPDFVRFAQAHGAHGHRPQSADDFLPTLQHAFDQGGVHLIDLAIDYSDNHRVLNEEIRSLSAAVKE